MASKSASKTTQKSAPARQQPVRQAITLELVQARAPHGSLAENLSRTFGIDPVDYAAIREGTEENVVRSANVLRDDLNCQIACNRDPLFAPNCDPLTA
jgi:hypothetical protein